MKRAAALLACVAALASPASAHKASDGYLTLERDASALAVRWDLALRDLELALGLDANGDGEITWGELRARHGAIAEYATARLRVTSGGVPCALRVAGHEVERHADGAYAVVRLVGDCERAGPLKVRYAALFDVDATHRGLVRIVEHGRSRSLVVAADGPQEAGDPSAVAQFGSYLAEGARHVLAGYDHLLFLLSLLLPAVLVRRAGEWRAATSLAAAAWDIVRVVTAFTVAHSITLALAVTGVVTLPSRPVEAAIALSVVVAALNNVWPVVDRGRWLVAFAFGLVHGFGFATVLVELGLPAGTLALALAGFNVGVELGQLASVAVVLPLAYAARHTLAYRHAVVVGSLVIAAIGMVWLVERAGGGWPGT